MLLLSLLQGGNTLVHAAASAGQTECLKLLLEAGADIHAKNNVRFLSHLLLLQILTIFNFNVEIDYIIINSIYISLKCML